MVVISHDLKSTKVINLDKVINPFKISYINENNLLLVSEKSIALFDMKRNIVRHVKQQPYRIIVCSRKDNLPLIFDDQGNMHLIRGLDNITTQKVPVEGKVTAYCESKNTGFEAYGMNDGTIWLTQKGSRMQKLIGHRSRISKMKLNGRRLYSAAYDGEVNLWITSNEKIEPITLAQTNNWIMSFNFDSSKNTFWMGDVKGNLTAVNISIPSMVAEIKKKLKRDFTQEEWNYFVGKNIPYESFLGKEVAP
jgi:WD40 repeat protein